MILPSTRSSLLIVKLGAARNCVKMKAKWRLWDVAEQWELNRITRDGYIFLYGRQLLLLFTIAWLNTRCITAHHLYLFCIHPGRFPAKSSKYSTEKNGPLLSINDLDIVYRPLFSLSSMFSLSFTFVNKNPRVKNFVPDLILSFLFPFTGERNRFRLRRLKTFLLDTNIQASLYGKRLTCFRKRKTTSHSSAKRWNFSFLPVQTNRH